MRHLLFLSHCLPAPPDKGERIRAFHIFHYLRERFRVHLVSIARPNEDASAALSLEPLCETVHVERLPRTALLAAGVRFAFGACLSTSYFHRRSIVSHIAALRARFPLSASFVYCSTMAQYAPDDIPMVADLVDVDSEKWLQYAPARFPGLAYRWEGGRLREVERAIGWRARTVLLATEAEADLYRRIAPSAHTVALSNGVDAAYFDAAVAPRLPELEDRRFAVFTGTMDYYPNQQAAAWFARAALPAVRERDPAFEFFVVGRNPSSAVRALAQLAGVTVTGAVPDVRPYLASARAFVAPLEVARGIQNKVLEALAMNLPALVSPSVMLTFGEAPPRGAIECASAADYANALLDPPQLAGAAREDVVRKFSWPAHLAALDAFL